MSNYYQTRPPTPRPLRKSNSSLYRSTSDKSDISTSVSIQKQDTSANNTEPISKQDTVFNLRPEKLEDIGWQKSEVRRIQERNHEQLYDLVMNKCIKLINQSTKDGCTSCFFTIPLTIGPANSFVILDPIPLRKRLIDDLLAKRYQVNNIEGTLYISWNTNPEKQDGFLSTITTAPSLHHRRKLKNAWMVQYRFQHPIFQDKSLVSILGHELTDQNVGTDEIIRLQYKGLQNLNK